MFRKTIETSLTPQVTVTECLGNLIVRGGTQKLITLSAPDTDNGVTWKREGETLTLAIPTNGTLVCPAGTTLTLKKVLGNLRIEGVNGPASVGVVHGNASLRAVGPVEMDGALGNLSAQGVAGQLRCQDIKGNARVSGISDRCVLGQVAGNLVAEGLQSGLTVDIVRGNIRLGPPFFANSMLRLKGYGNLTVLAPATASLRLNLRAGGQARSLVPGLTLENVDGQTTGTLGTGETELEGDVNGNVTVEVVQPGERPELDGSWDELGAHIEWQVNDALAKLATSLEETLGRMGGGWARDGVDRAAEQARRKAEQAAERARMRAERAERRWRRASGRRPAAKRQEATDEERIRVLRMVEEGKITPEEATQLLGAIEGK